MFKFLKLNSRKTEEHIYFKYADEMIVLCLRYLGNIEDAEEVMNNGFLKVFSNLSTFKPEHENSFKAWIKKIMINECLMRIRKQKIDLTIRLDSEEISLSEDPILEYSAEYLLDLLAALPDGYRTVFNLYAIEGYKHKEIAEMLQISENTSRSQLLKARKMLQNHVNIQNSNDLLCARIN